MSEAKSNRVIATYTIGYVLSLVLSLGAYFMVTNFLKGGHGQSNRGIIAAVMVFAFIQLLVQMVFFLHLGDETKPRWRLIVFSFMVSVVLILVVGTLWIMKNLDYSHEHASPKEIDKSIIEDEGYEQ